MEGSPVGAVEVLQIATPRAGALLARVAVGTSVVLTRASRVGLGGLGSRLLARARSVLPAVQRRVP
eukprot:11841995-Alexandrium_andersonii.AAC.1